MSKFCVNCGAQVDENTKFCSNCGKGVDEKVEEVVKTEATTVNAEPIQNTDGKKTDGLAIAAFVVSLVGLLIFGLPCGIISLCLGIPALRRIKLLGEKGRGLAIAGIAVGGFDIGAVLLATILRMAVLF